jgi:serine/threonine-protein kinase
MSAGKPIAVGTELAAGRYRITGKLGEGGMGLVFRAWDRHLRTDVVIKVPHVGPRHDAQFVERFAGEVRSLVKLAHPHIVTVLDAGEHEGVPYAVMAYLSGGSLESRRTHGDGRLLPVPADSVGLWLEPIAGALDFIHRQKYIHRDVKPDNILFDAHNHPYLSDFGVAKALAALTTESRPRAVTGNNGLPGTLEYMAPEMILGKPCDGRADQYSLALTLHDLLTGKPPFEGMHPAAILFAQVEGTIAPAHELEPSVPKAVSQVIRKALSKDPAERFGSCLAFAKTVAEALESSRKASVRAGRATVAERPEGAPAPATSAETVFRYDCPECGKRLKFRSDPRNRQIRCTACQKILTVPDDARVRVESAPVSASESVPGSAVQAPVAPPAASATLSRTVEGMDPPTHERSARMRAPEMTVSPDRTLEDGFSRASGVARGGFPRWLLWAAVTTGALSAAAGTAIFLWPPGLARHKDAPSDLITRDGVVTGTVEIDFGTRSKIDAEGNPLPDAVDTYTVDLRVRTGDDEEVRYTGSIIRRPKVKAEGDKPRGGTDVSAFLKFQLFVTAYPLDAEGRPVEGKSRTVGTIGGIAPLTEDGRYLFGELLWTAGPAAPEKFRGEVQGKNTAAGDRVPKRLSFGVGRDVIVEVKRPDPMIFRGFKMPADPVLRLPAPVLEGALTFDYDTNCFLTDDLVFRYDDAADKVQGTIVWQKDDEYLKSGRSEYVFNLVFNPSGGGGGNAEVYKGQEKDLVTVDASTMSALTGTVVYVDTGPVVTVEGEQELNPLKSTVTFRLNANRLTPRQIHHFLRMWLLMSGPVNDE